MTFEEMLSKMTEEEVREMIFGLLDTPHRDPATCPHNCTQGDNYGESCMDCGTQLRGYGFWGQNDHCIHQFYDVDETYKQCVFCERMELK